jgi:hypothetical protein
LGSGEFQIPSFLDFGICAETLPVKHLESKMLRNLKLYFFECWPDAQKIKLQSILDFQIPDGHLYFRINYFKTE